MLISGTNFVTGEAAGKVRTRAPLSASRDVLEEISPNGIEPNSSDADSEVPFPFSGISATLPLMKLEIVLLATTFLVLPLHGQLDRTERKSLLNTDPEVVYLEETLGQPLKLHVIKEAPVFSDREGNNRLGVLRSDQDVTVEAITDKIYRVRGKGARYGIAGWVAPWAFSSKDPDFVENLKDLYKRQIQVQKLVAAHDVAVGMTLGEVSLSRGKPTKTSVRKEAAGQSGRWEYIDFEDVRNYVTEIDRSTGQAYRRLVSVTRVEKGKTAVEFKDDVVTAVEESANNRGGDTRIIVPPLVFRW